MKMRKALFLKVSPGDISLKIDGIKTRIKQGQTFVHFYEVVNGLPGIKFLRFIDDKPQQSYTSVIYDKPSSPPLFTPEYQVKNTSQEEKQDISFQQQILCHTTKEEKPNQNEEQNEHYNIIPSKDTQSYICENNHNELNDNNKEENIKNTEDITTSINIDFLKEIKKKTNKELLSLSKNELKEILITANVDIQHIKDTRIELYKFLASLLKTI
ncbi:MAG: hypothetical protein QW279_07155 [Candidatus Jordarchaeaceae archaeon]